MSIINEQQNDRTGYLFENLEKRSKYGRLKLSGRERDHPPA